MVEKIILTIIVTFPFLWLEWVVGMGVWIKQKSNPFSIVSYPRIILGNIPMTYLNLALWIVLLYLIWRKL